MPRTNLVLEPGLRVAVVDKSGFVFEATILDPTGWKEIPGVGPRKTPRNRGVAVAVRGLGSYLIPRVVMPRTILSTWDDYMRGEDLRAHQVQQEERRAAVLLSRLAAAGVRAEAEDGFVRVPVDQMEKMFQSLDEAERVLLEVAALRQCEPGQHDPGCEVRLAARLAGDVAEVLLRCGGRYAGTELRRMGAQKRRGFDQWVSTGGEPSRARASDT